MEEIIDRPTMALYHPNAKGTGCAMRMRLYPAPIPSHDMACRCKDNEGYVLLEMSCQTSTERFGWDDTIEVKLRFDELASIIRVLRGEEESMLGGRGLIVRNDDVDDDPKRVCLRHILEPMCGYSLEVYSKDKCRHIVLSDSEAMGILCALETSMCFVVFGKAEV